MKASDVADAAVLAAIEDVSLREGRWALRCDLESLFPGVPEKVLLAKLRRLVKRGVIDGCACGCRGDFTVKRERPASP